MKHVPPNTVTQQQYSTALVQHTQNVPPGMLWGTHNITHGNSTQGNNTYSVSPPTITVQQEPNMLGEMYNVLQQIKLESGRLADSTGKHQVYQTYHMITIGIKTIVLTDQKFHHGVITLTR